MSPYQPPALHYLEAGVAVTAFLAAVDLEELFFADFFVLFVPVALVAATLLAAFGAAAGVVCAAKEIPASASVMVIPMIAETVLFIVLFFLCEKRCIVCFCL
jgi:hypothetical protein